MDTENSVRARIRTVRDVTTFISNWTGTPCSCPGGPRPLSPSVPEPVRVLDELLGAFWGPPPYPISPLEADFNTERGLFEVQDSIVDPRSELLDGDINLLVNENQGVWRFGYAKDQQVMVQGDWIWNGHAQTLRDWTPFSAGIEDVLVFALLQNFFFYSYAETNLVNLDFDDPDLRASSVLLWSHPSWSGFKGFYTNHEEKIFALAGFGVIQRN